MAPGSPSVDERVVVMVEKQQGHVGVKQTAAFLASTEAGYITGQTLIIDGGQLLPETPEAILPPRD